MTKTKHYNDLFQKQCLTNWDELMDYYRTLRDEGKQWVFREQTNAGKGLETTLERLAQRFSIDFSELPKTERALVRKIQREASLYISRPPKKKDLMQWLALMQHYGTPTSLLDWMYSFFVAAYFAFETVKPESCCAIWMIDYKWLRRMTKESVPDSVRSLIEQDEDLKKPKTVNCLLTHSPPISTVCRLNPLHLNEWLALQQGTFLAPADVTRSFMDNFKVLCSSRASRDHFVKLSLVADLSFTKDAISELHRMNINRATLFPGLDGFATSLGNAVVIPEVVLTYGLSAE